MRLKMKIKRIKVSKHPIKIEIYFLSIVVLNGKTIFESSVYKLYKKLYF